MNLVPARARGRVRIVPAATGMSFDQPPLLLALFKIVQCAKVFYCTMIKLIWINIQDEHLSVCVFVTGACGHLSGMVNAIVCLFLWSCLVEQEREETCVISGCGQFCMSRMIVLWMLMIRNCISWHLTGQWKLFWVLECDRSLSCNRGCS